MLIWDLYCRTSEVVDGEHRGNFLDIEMNNIPYTPCNGVGTVRVELVGSDNNIRIRNMQITNCNTVTKLLSHILLFLNNFMQEMVF